MVVFVYDFSIQVSARECGIIFMNLTLLLLFFVHLPINPTLAGVLKNAAQVLKNNLLLRRMGGEDLG